MQTGEPGNEFETGEPGNEARNKYRTAGDLSFCSISHAKGGRVALIVRVSLYHSTAGLQLGGWVHTDANVIRVGLVSVLPSQGVAVRSCEHHVNIM